MYIILSNIYHRPIVYLEHHLLMAAASSILAAAINRSSLDGNELTGLLDTLFPYSEIYFAAFSPAIRPELMANPKVVPGRCML